MAYNDGTDIWLALSVASDEMMRTVHMFLEVVYMYVISGINKQKRDLFLMVVKDGNGETYIGNVTIIPSQKLWVFMKIYQTFCLYLYGTVSQFQLAVTDDDVSAHGPFDCLIKTSNCYSNCTHILCVFHGFIMTFQTKIYPLLPHKKGTKMLTKKRELYGKLRVHFQIHQKNLFSFFMLHQLFVKREFWYSPIICDYPRLHSYFGIWFFSVTPIICQTVFLSFTYDFNRPRDSSY